MKKNTSPSLMEKTRVVLAITGKDIVDARKNKSQAHLGADTMLGYGLHEVMRGWVVKDAHYEW